MRYPDLLAPQEPRGNAPEHRIHRCPGLPPGQTRLGRHMRGRACPREGGGPSSSSRSLCPNPQNTRSTKAPGARSARNSGVSRYPASPACPPGSEAGTGSCDPGALLDDLWTGVYSEFRTGAEHRPRWPGKGPAIRIPHAASRSRSIATASRAQAASSIASGFGSTRNWRASILRASGAISGPPGASGGRQTGSIADEC